MYFYIDKSTFRGRMHFQVLQAKKYFPFFVLRDQQQPSVHRRVFYEKKTQIYLLNKKFTMKKLVLLVCIAVATLFSSVYGQRQMENLDRGLVAEKLLTAYL